MLVNTRKILPALFAATALTLVGCTNADVPADSKPETPASADLRTWQEIQDSGVLMVGTITDYPPNEFKTDSGDPTGWAVELVEAIASELDLEIEYELLLFDNILPRIQSGGIDLGVGSFTDTVERQQVVDFVNYYEAGSLWASPTGSEITPDTACGHTVAAMAGGTQLLFELPERSQTCVDNGEQPIEIIQFTGQPEVTNAVMLGRADAFTADSPVTVDAVNTLGDKLQVAGDIYDTAPYGFPIGKGSELGEHVREALQNLIDDGTYEELLVNYHSEMGAITEASINAGAE